MGIKRPNRVTKAMARVSAQDRLTIDDLVHVDMSDVDPKNLRLDQALCLLHRDDRCVPFCQSYLELRGSIYLYHLPSPHRAA